MCALVFVCEVEEKVLGRQQAPGSCPYCGGTVMATDVETARKLCCIPICINNKRKYSCNNCSRRLETTYPSS